MNNRIKGIGCLLLVFLLLVGCQSPNNQKTEPVQRTQFVLGTVITVALYDNGSEELLDRIFDRLLEIENLMSANLDASEIGQINLLSGQEEVVVSDETLEVIEKGLYYGQLSKGAFDITMEPIVKLWNIGTEEASVPNEDVLKFKLSKVGYQKVVVDTSRRSVFLPEEGMGLDLGGIAKGYAADEIVKLLEVEGVSKAMLNLGGNVYAMGKKSVDQKWKIGIQNPFDERNEYFGVVAISDHSVVTSGPYERYFEEDGKRYHHIFDTTTGWPIENEIASVSVVAKSSVDGDALSTTFFALGVEEGLLLAESLEGVECIFVDINKNVSLTSGLKGNFDLTDTAYRFAD